MIVAAQDTALHTIVNMTPFWRFPSFFGGIGALSRIRP